MKIFNQLILIIGIYVLGDIITKALSLPIPGNILGMIILLILLSTRILKVNDVEDVSNFLLSNLAFLFIPAGVGLISSFDIVKSSIIQIIIICIITTIITLGSTGKIVEFLLNKKNKSDKENTNGTTN